MRIGWGDGRAAVVMALAVASLTFSTLAEPTLSASFGFDHQLVRHRFAPLHVVVSGLPQPIAGRLIVRQFIGPDPDTPIVVEHDIVAGRIANGTYNTTLPACDPILPVVIQLVDDQGSLIASAAESVRQSARGLPFTVIAGAAYHADDTEAIVDPSELPSDWWAYDGVSSLWLASPLLSRATWVGLGAWVSAGGSLVLFSGPDFYQWDSLIARALLPLTELSLRDGRDDILILVGRPRAGAQVLLTKDDEPLLIRLPYGAGFVSLVTRRFGDLDEMDLRRIQPRIVSARPLVSAGNLSEDLLNGTSVVRPMYAFAPLVVVAVLVILFLVHRRSARHATSAVALLVVATAVVAVASGFYLNRLGRIAYGYTINTNIHVATAFGLTTASYAFFSLEPSTMTIPQEKGAFPAQVHRIPTAKSVYAMRSGMTSTSLDLPARTRRFVRSCDTRDAGFRLTVDDAARSLRVEQVEARRVVAGMIFADGFFHRLPLERIGETLALDDLCRLGTSAMTAAEDMGYASAKAWMPSLTGTWLLIVSEATSLAGGGEIPEKVRVIDIDIVEAVSL